ncbi:phage protein [Streptococcus pneumoniae]|nr:phage protein [Streptococcus pneumoniae]
MNIKALIKKYEELWNERSPFYEPVPYTSMVELFLKELKQLDEPEKVKVPQCVAEYIEFKKKNNFHVYGAMRVIEDHYDKKVPDWFYENNIEKFCLAWLNGYEVEKEKRYTVVMKETKQPLYYNAGDKKLFFSLGGIATKFTRKQLEDTGFGWVFDCEGIEIEEVE